MSISKIKKGDNVIVIAGKDKGKLGAVSRVDNDGYVLVEGINLVYKTVKANPQQERQGGIIRKEARIHISNIAQYNSALNKADRVKIKVLADGKKLRCYASNQENIDDRI